MSTVDRRQREFALREDRFLDCAQALIQRDGRVWRRLTEDADDIEHEYLVEVRGAESLKPPPLRQASPR